MPTHQIMPALEYTIVMYQSEYTNKKGFMKGVIFELQSGRVETLADKIELRKAF